MYGGLMIAKSAKLVDFAQLLGLWFSPPMFPYQFKGGFGQKLVHEKAIHDIYGV